MSKGKGVEVRKDEERKKNETVGKRRKGKGAEVRKDEERIRRRMQEEEERNRSRS